jgi:hypothetical protein
MSETTELMSAQSWEYTRGYAGVFGTPPAPFVTAIRTLLNEESNGAPQPSSATLYQILRLMKSPSLFAPFYFAACTFVPTAISSTSRTTEAAVLKSFSAFEIASLLAVTYLSRRAQALCDADELKLLEDLLVEEVNLGFLVGRAIPSIGAGMCLLQAATPVLGLAAFLRHDPNGFKEHRRLLKKQNLKWDHDLEMQRWGCTRVQIGSVLAQSLGFGIKRANAITNSLMGVSESLGAEETETTHDAKMAALWSESIRTTRKAPEIAMPAKYYPSNTALQDTLAALDTLQGNPSQARWLYKGRDDLPSYQLQQGADRASTGKALNEYEAMQSEISSIDTAQDSE